MVVGSCVVGGVSAIGVVSYLLGKGSLEAQDVIMGMGRLVLNSSLLLFFPFFWGFFVF